MMKILDFSKTVYELTEAYPELIKILKELGFLGVVNPVVRKTVGRVTTIPQGCEKQGKDIKEVISILKKNGFTLKAG